MPAEELKDTTTSTEEAMRQADKNAGLPPADTKVQAPADAIDLTNRIDKADETPAEGLAKLVKLQKDKDEAGAKALAKENDDRALAHRVVTKPAVKK